ncbi:4856_t:CDS:2 [Entrophospora sp. SA101]|nr:4856_t:CDS:2 [Entrophospora sp. SA101]
MEETIILGQTIDPLELVKFLQNIDISTIDKPINLFNLSLLIQQMYKEASSTVSMIQETLLSSSNHHYTFYPEKFHVKISMSWESQEDPTNVKKWSSMKSQIKKLFWCE